MLVRVKYSKTEAGRFLSHLDLLRTFERVFRRAGLPLVFSEGFNPHPKISYASALAVGITSDAEYLDVEIAGDIVLAEMMERLQPALPPGLRILELQKMDKRPKSLTSVINMARYVAEIPLNEACTQAELDEVIAAIMHEPQLLIQRDRKKGRVEIDIRKGIYALRGSVKDRTLYVEMDVQTGSEGNVRPDEVIELMRKFGGIDMKESLRLNRLGLFIRDNLFVRSPLNGS